MSTNHCRECESQVCNHGNCPECNPCQHCYGGDRQNKYLPEDEERDRQASEREMPRYLSDGNEVELE